MGLSFVSAGRLPKDRDFVETVEGMLFCVVDYLHPPGKVTAYLKYSPAPEGRWQRDGAAFHRELAYYHAHQVGQTLDYLEAHYPEYIDTCPVRDMRFSMIPHERVALYYRPEARLAQVLERPGDSMEQELAALTESLLAATGIPLESLGITGSMLLGIHNPSFSDLDIIVYGVEAADCLRSVLAGPGIPGVGPVMPSVLARWRRDSMDHHGLSEAQVDWLITRRWNYASYEGRRYLSFHPTRSDAEIREHYGDHTYRDAGVCRLRAVVTDAAEAIYLPAIYRVAQVHFLEGPEADVREIRSYEGLFGEVADAGQEIEARGKLERIDGGPAHRLVIGSSHRAGREYVLPAGL